MAILTSWLGTIGLNGMLGLAAYWVARHGFRQAPGVPRALGAVVAAWVWSTLGMELLGSFGLLALAPLLGWSALGVAIGWTIRDRDRSQSLKEPPGQSEAWEAGAVVALGLVLWAATIHGVRSLVAPVEAVSDGPIYHLYFAARWWRAGRLFLVAAPFGENAATYFPAVGDLWFTWLLIGWGDDRLARVGQAPFLFVAGLASYALARRLGAGKSAAIVAAAWFVTSAPLFLFSFQPNVDTIFVAGFLIAVYFLLRYAIGDDGLPALALGSLAAGGALGTKATGIVFVPVLFLPAIVAVAYRTRAGGRWSAVALVLLLPMVMAGYWYGRSTLLTGNPLYPLHVRLFGRVWLAGWYGPDVMRLSRYYLPLDNGRALGDTLLAALDPRLVPVWLSALLGAWSWGQTDRTWRAWVWGCTALAVLNVGLYWLLIPYRTQQRFMLQALGLAAVPLALTLQRSRGLRALAVVLLGVHLLSAQGWPFAGPGRPIPWDLSPVIPNEVPGLIAPPLNAAFLRQIPTHTELLGTLLAIMATAAAPMIVAWAWGRATRLPAGRRRIEAAGLTCAALGLAIALAWPREVDPRLRFYPRFRDYYRAWLELDSRSGPSGSRIAYAGTNIPYYLLGVGLRNEVRYVNVDGRRDWLLHDYHREARRRGMPTWPHPRPGWDRAHPRYDAWLANLRSERIQMLVVARANPDEGPHNLADPEGFPIERQWADAHPETFEPLYGVRERDPEMRIYRVKRGLGNK